MFKRQIHLKYYNIIMVVFVMPSVNVIAPFWDDSYLAVTLYGYIHLGENIRNIYILSLLLLLSLGLSQEFEDEVQLFQDSAHQKFPELVSTDDGTLHLVWVRELGSNKNVMYSNSTDNGMTFSDPIQINHNSNSIVAYIQAGPKIKLRGNELLIAYMDHRSGLTNIYLNYSIDNGLSWSEDILVSDQSYLQAYQDFEVAPNGIIHLIY